MKSYRIAGVLIVLLLTVSLQAWIKGDRCLGKWSDGYWYPGTIVNVAEGNYSVAFDDGDSTTLDGKRIRSMDWKTGTYLQCNWNGEGVYYSGKIASMNGYLIHMVYDDGDEEDTEIGLCRSLK